jgi:hypothetical protein
VGDGARTGGSTGEDAVLAETGRVPREAKRTETETTLVVVADTPEDVADAVAALTELDGFALLPAPDQSIRDRYFDTSEGVLAATGTGLRIRELDDRRLLTIKGPARPGAHGGVTRTEQEEAWPDRAWAVLRAELGTVLGVPAAPAASDPVRALEALGLAVVQDRRIARRVRAALPPSGARARVAELAVDAVTFELDGRAVRHHELELEVKAEGGDADTAALARRLERRFAPALRPWHLGKLSTGKALGRLIDELGPEAVLTADGSVRPSAYDEIESRGR